jgi:hypothetical protein
LRGVSGRLVRLDYGAHRRARRGLDLDVSGDAPVRLQDDAVEPRPLARDPEQLLEVANTRDV